MCLEFDEWRGLLGDRNRSEPLVSVVGILQAQSESRGGSLPFQVLASDERVYWVKMVGNPQGSRVLSTEQIVSECGRYIEAPVCETTLIEIPEDFDGDELENGTILRAGIAHASLDVENANLGKWHTPQYRDQDDNRKRHAGYFALYDWCWGDDMQWLYDLNEDRKTYSHDHGHFLPGGPQWSVESLKENVDVSREIDPLATGLDDEELVRIADLLDNLHRDFLLDVLQAVPSVWPIDSRDLEVIGWFLEKRSSGVAGRLRVLAERNRTQG